MARILVVDDQKSALLALDSILTKHDHVVVTATNFYDAMEYLKTQPIDLMITDAVMPGISGYDLIKTVRNDGKYAKLGIIMVTGRREKKDVQRSVEAGADDYVVKPIDPDILMGKVKGLLSKRSTSSAGFYDCPVHFDAKWMGNTQVVSISEMGMTLTTTLQMPIGFKVQVDCELFKLIGIEIPTLRITNCTLQDTNSQMFIIHGHFVGLSEKELQFIRLWLFKKKDTAA